MPRLIYFHRYTCVLLQTTGFPPHYQRGPLCFDCQNLDNPAKCDRVSLCANNEVSIFVVVVVVVCLFYFVVLVVVDDDDDDDNDDDGVVVVVFVVVVVVFVVIVVFCYCCLLMVFYIVNDSICSLRCCQ